MDKVAGLLDRHRLVTVTGPGGSGKTRLALEAARRVGDRFADGVAWVDLSGVDQGALVPATIAAAVGVQERAGDSMLASLVVGLSARQLLLVLDNCEQVADAVAETCECLLSECDDLWILATSTRALKVQGEARLRVPSLPLPAPGGTLAEIGASEAVVLFIDRVSDTDPDFALTADTEEAVAEIVRRLDGMPLAVELAAARVSALGISELRAGLDDRFTVLVENSRGAPARQQSLLAAVDWSYRLLPEAEQGVYRRLGVFAGPFTLAAATAVAGPQARDAVPHLVDCSLLVPPVAGVDGRSRYRRLETIRAHADTLLAGKERVEAATALLQWAVTQPFDMQAPHDFTDRDFATLAWIDAEQDNLRQAIEWAAVQDPTARLRLVTAMGPWYRLRGRYREGVATLDAGLAGCPDPSPRLGSDAEYWLGDLAHHLGRFEEAVTHYGAAAARAEAGDEFAALADSLAAGVGPLANTGRLDQADRDAQRALVTAQDAGYRAGVGAAYVGQATVAHYRGTHEAALSLVDQAEQAAGPGGQDLASLRAECYLELGRFSQAEEVALAGLAVARDRADLFQEAWYRRVLADAYVRSGRISEAASFVSEALRLAWRLGEQVTVSDGLTVSARVSAGMGRPQEAAMLLAAKAAMDDTTGLAVAPYEEWPDLLKDIHDALSAEQLAAAHDRGAAMGIVAAIELACALATPSASVDHAFANAGIEPNLSARERELVVLVAQGSTDAQIAQRLFISIRTVRSHLDRIRDKTGCRRRADLTRFALQTRLV